MIYWPSELPFFTSHGDIRASGPQRAVLRSEMDVGPDKVRRRTTAAPRSYSGVIPALTRGQFEFFEDWFRDGLHLGVLPFEALNPVTLNPALFRFRGDYSQSLIGARVRVSATLEILP